MKSSLGDRANRAATRSGMFYLADSKPRNSMEPSYSIFVAVCALLAATWGYFAWRKHQAERDFAPDADKLTPRLNPLAGLSFDDALDSEKFAGHIRQAVEKALLQSAVGVGIHVDHVQIESEPSAKGNLLVTFANRMADGTEGGSQFELAQNAQGAYRAIAKGVTAGADLGDIDLMAVWLRRFAAGTTAVVSVANVISGADAANKLKTVLKGQEQMFAYRTIDQFAGLRTVYERLREELAKEPPSADALNDLRHKLREIRHALLGEAKTDLAKLEFLYPEHTGLLAKPRMTWDAIAKRGGSEPHNARLKELEAFRGKLLLARKCLDVEQISAASAGVADSQRILLEEAASEVREMLPYYQELEEEAIQGDSLTETLSSLFAG